MIKLFITLNVLLIAVLVAYLIGVQSIGEFLVRPYQEAHYQTIGKGTFNLLNRSVEGLDADQRDTKVKALATHFDYPMSLQSRDQQAFSDHEKERLEQGLVVRLEQNEADILFAYLPETELMWSVAFDQPPTMDEENTASGTAYLIQLELEQFPADQQPAAMERLKREFGFDIKLVARDELTLDAQHLLKLDAGKLVSVIENEDDSQLYLQLKNSSWVVHVPNIELPWIAPFINLIILGMLVLLVALVSLLWIWTLWRNLSQIRRAAERFGEGQYDTRVPFKKSSRLAQLSQAFNTMAEQTQNSIRSHKELTSAVSHELRTPVARMRFSLDMLADSDDASDKARYINNMNTDMDELDSLLNELLTYARLDQGGSTAKLQIEALCPWLDQAMKSLQPLSGSVALTWECDELAKQSTATFDPVLLNRLLSNLVQNAIRYANTRVLVSISVSGEQVLLCVDDDGIGIPESERERLFEAFATQDSSRNKASDGFGLGLAIVQRISKAHNGRVEIQDSPLGGARFCLSWAGISMRSHEATAVSQGQSS